MIPVDRCLVWVCPTGEGRGGVLQVSTRSRLTRIQGYFPFTHFEVIPPPLTIGGRMVEFGCLILVRSSLGIRRIRARSWLCTCPRTRRTGAQRRGGPSNYGAHCPPVPFARFGVHLAPDPVSPRRPHPAMNIHTPVNTIFRQC